MKTVCVVTSSAYGATPKNLSSFLRSSFETATSPTRFVDLVHLEPTLEALNLLEAACGLALTGGVTCEKFHNWRGRRGHDSRHPVLGSR